jgi:hypothetical protein
LRKKIVEELFELTRLESDDEIKLGKGGALPQTGIDCQKRAYIITGLPASGKSGVADKLADLTHSIILDPDHAKRKIPEYYRHNYGASLVHEESSFLISGGGHVPDIPMCFQPLSVKCASKGYNVCIPKIGNTVESVERAVKPWKDRGYEVHLILVQLDRKLATIRALNRFRDTNRYVPLGLIFDGYSNDPLITYYRLKNKNEVQRTFESFGKLSTDVELNSLPKVMDVVGSSPVINF